MDFSRVLKHWKQLWRQLECPQVAAHCSSFHHLRAQLLSYSFCSHHLPARHLFLLRNPLQLYYPYHRNQSYRLSWTYQCNHGPLLQSQNENVKRRDVHAMSKLEWIILDSGMEWTR